MIEKRRDVRSADTCLVLAKAWAPLVTAFLVVVACASAQCPSIRGAGNPHWTWNTLEWVYNGSLSTNGIYGAASAWNSGQSFTTISKSAVLSAHESLLLKHMFQLKPHLLRQCSAKPKQHRRRGGRLGVFRGFCSSRSSRTRDWSYIWAGKLLRPG
jgi:hypothetical protein